MKIGSAKDSCSDISAHARIVLVNSVKLFLLHFSINVVHAMDAHDDDYVEQNNESIYMYREN